MYKLTQQNDGSFRVELDYDLIALLTDEQFNRYFYVKPYTRDTFIVLQKIKEVQAQDKEVPPKKRKLSRIS